MFRNARRLLNAEIVQEMRIDVSVTHVNPISNFIEKIGKRNSIA